MTDSCWTQRTQPSPRFGPPDGRNEIDSHQKALRFTEQGVRNCVCCALAGGAICSPFDRFQQRRTHMTNEIFAVRIAQALLAVAATVVSVLALQFAMLAG